MTVIRFREEDVRRARALAAQVTVALEVSRNLSLSEQHRRKAESLTSLALEINSLLRGRDFARNFVARFAEMMDAPVAALITDNSSLGCIFAPQLGIRSVLNQRKRVLRGPLSQHSRRLPTQSPSFQPINYSALRPPPNPGSSRS